MPFLLQLSYYSTLASVSTFQLSQSSTESPRNFRPAEKKHNAHDQIETCRPQVMRALDARHALQVQYGAVISNIFFALYLDFVADILAVREK